jgi:hypothetical protein
MPVFQSMLDVERSVFDVPVPPSITLGDHLTVFHLCTHLPDNPK